MTVAELIAFLQKQDPESEVVLRDSCDDVSYVKVREFSVVELRVLAPFES